ncbi:hypothetical protein ACI3PF_14725, partial [Lactococcus lactis]
MKILAFLNHPHIFLDSEHYYLNCSQKYLIFDDTVVLIEQLKIAIEKIKAIQESSIIKSKKEWGILEEKMLGYLQIDKAFIHVFSDHVIFLVQLEQQYRQRLSIFANNLDNSVRYL